jgi:hypothetical protein
VSCTNNNNNSYNNIIIILYAGGHYIWCTSAAPASRLAYFRYLGGCAVTVYRLSSEGGAPESESNLAYMKNMLCGPGVHFVYVFTKSSAEHLVVPVKNTNKGMG